MSTGAYLSDTPEILTSTHRQIFRARASHPDWNAPISLEVTDFTLSADEATAPRWGLSLTCAAPDAATRVLLDPRTGVRIELEAGYVRPDGIEDATLVADLTLRTYTYQAASDAIALSAASDESLVIDASPNVTGALTGTPLALIPTLIAGCISPTPVITTSGPTGTSVTVDPITDKWGTIDDLADRISADVYDNGLRAWVIAPRPTLAGTPALIITPGTNGTMIDALDVLDRAQWHNYVWVRYRWRSGATDNQVIATAYAQTGPYAITGPAGKRTLSDDRNVPTTQADANAAAVALLTRRLSKARSSSVDTIAAWWIRPGSTVTVAIPGATSKDYLVTRVEWTTGGRMRLDLRLPEIVPVIATTTPSGSSATTDPTPPTVKTYVSTWPCSSSATYNGDGTKRNDLSGEVSFGYYSSTHGNQTAVLMFGGANSTGSETGKTIAQALAGATVLKTELVATATHWYSYSGGKARIGVYPGITIPTTYGSAAPYLTTDLWAKGSPPRTFNITSATLSKALVAGTSNAITLGPGASTDQSWYGKVANESATNTATRPSLRITYAKP